MSTTSPRLPLVLGLLAASLAAFLPACREGAPPAAVPSAAAARYHCPMHPTFVSDRPGDCRICGMKLVPFEVAPESGAASAVDGRAVVTLSPERRQRLGVRTEEVRRRPARRSLRTPGRVSVDERRLHHIHTKYDGYVEHLHVDFTGKFVRKGEPLLSIYSPELLATQQEYLLAYRAKARLAESGIGSVAQGGADLLEAARQRLLFWDVRPDDIASLERTGQVKRTLDLHSEVSGYVVQKMAFHGMRVTPADVLFDIADLSRLWVLADVYESDLAFVRVGMAAEVSVPYRPGRVWKGPVTNVAPTVDETTRTIKVRIEVPNAGEELKPEMLADVRLEADLGTRLMCPGSAVLEAGNRRIVFRENEEGGLEPVEVSLGAKLDGGLEVMAGLAEGDRVVTSANFLLDSESSLRAALARLAPGASPPGAPPRPPRPGTCTERPANVIASIIRFSATNRLFVLLVAAVAVGYGIYTLNRIPVDAIPDLSDTQVIVYSRWDRSPDLIEDQVTYPIVAGLLGAPGVKVVRGLSDFGFSYVYVIFQDGTDLYWARSRVLEYLSRIQPQLPAGVKTELGPDATGVGWVFQYALVDDEGRHRPGELRAFQDWHLRYRIQSVPGVAEVASLGGFVEQYQVTVDPRRLQSYGLAMSDVAKAVRDSNAEVGGRLLELGGREYMIRGRGYLTGTADLETVVLRTDGRGTPVLLGDVARVASGPEIRRGVSDLDGRGDVVSGIVVMRHGENAREVIRRVKARLEEARSSFPEGVSLVVTYDRSSLIERALSTLRHELLLEILIVSLVIVVFLWHIPSAVVPIVTIPVSVLLAFVPMAFFGISANIMSLAGIAISIGVLVDGAIVEVENAYKKLELWEQGGRHGDFHAVRLQALLEVGPSVFFSLLVIAVAFLPVFTLVDQAGRLFKPLAFTKNLTMAVAALLAITLDPALRMLFTRMDFVAFRPRWLAWLWNHATVGRYRPETEHPVSRGLFAVYGPACRAVLRHPRTTIALALLLVATTVPAYLALGHEFMPALDEGTLLYMPTTLPGLSVAEASRLLESQDRVLAAFPEVERVFGKAGRAETATDSAPLSMIETTLLLRPPEEWRARARFYSGRAPEWLQALVLRRVWPDRISRDELLAELDTAMRFPGVTNAWTMPIKARIDMLSTGLRTPVGIKVYGGDLAEIDRIGQRLEAVLREVPGTRSAFAERAAGGYYVDFDLRRDALARYGLTVAEVEDVILSAVGGENVTVAVQGRARVPVNVRYPRELRDDLDALGRVLVKTPAGAQVPMSELCTLRTLTGPSMIRNENGLLAGYVFVDNVDSDIGGFVERAKAAVAAQVALTPGTSLEWSGQYENMLRVRERLYVVVPLTLFIIFFLLWANTKSAAKAGLVMLAVPFSAVGAVWLMYALDYNVSIAAWVGVIALMGLDAETGVFMLLFLDLSLADAEAKGRLRTRAELEEAIVHGAVGRVRPKMMTVTAAMAGLMPIMWSVGTGADVMKRVAAPMVGGLATSFLLELLVYPAIYLLWNKRRVS